MNSLPRARLLLLLLVALGAAFHAGAASAAAPEAPAAGPVAARPQVTLRLVDWASLDEMAIDESTLAAFRNKYPSIEVLYEPNPGHQYEEKILTGLAAGAPPDVFLLDSKLIPTFTNKQVLLDLGPLVRRLGIDTAQWFPTVLEIGRRGSALFALPKGFTPLMVYYNRRLFDSAGLSYPKPGWTWEEYREIARRLTLDRDGDGRPEQYGTAFTNYYYYWIPWVWSAGGDVLSPDGQEASGRLNSRETEHALQFLIDLRQKDRAAPDAGSWTQAEKTGTNSALFAGGKIAMIVDGHWRMPGFLRYVQQGKLDIGVAPIPRDSSGKGSVNVLYESGWCVPVNAPHPEEAALLAAFMAGETACRIRARGRLEIPSAIRVAGEFAARDSTGLERAFVDQVPACRQPWGSKIERFSEVEWTLQDAVDEVMLNGRPIHETLTRYAARIDRQLAEIRSHANSPFRPIREEPEILWFLLAGAFVALLVGTIVFLRARVRERNGIRAAIAFLSPSLIHLVVFVFTPIAFAAYLSLHRWDIVAPDKPFVGAENFAAMGQDPTFWNALKNTLLFSLNVPVGMALALAVALVLRHRLRGLGFLRTLYFLPSVSSFVAIALVWMWIYHPSFGAANVFLGAIGLPPLGWLNSPGMALPAVMIFSVWLGLGYQMVIFLAGLQGIPEEFHDAARIDGAGTWQRFRHVTLPLLKPTTFFILVTSLIGSFQVFTTVYVMTAGGPVRSTDVFVYHIYEAAWEELRMGYAAAMSWVLFVIIMVATWVQFKFMGQHVEY